MTVCLFSPLQPSLRINDPGGFRTNDLRIKSPLLYQLSYRVELLILLAIITLHTSLVKRPVWRVLCMNERVNPG